MNPLSLQYLFLGAVFALLFTHPPSVPRAELVEIAEVIVAGRALKIEPGEAGELRLRGTGIRGDWRVAEIVVDDVVKGDIKRASIALKHFRPSNEEDPPEASCLAKIGEGNRYLLFLRPSDKAPDGTYALIEPYASSAFRLANTPPANVARDDGIVERIEKEIANTIESEGWISQRTLWAARELKLKGEVIRRAVESKRKAAMQDPDASVRAKCMFLRMAVDHDEQSLRLLWDITEGHENLIEFRRLGSFPLRRQLGLAPAIARSEDKRIQAGLAMYIKLSFEGTSPRGEKSEPKLDPDFVPILMRLLNRLRPQDGYWAFLALRLIEPDVVKEYPGVVAFKQLHDEYVQKWNLWWEKEGKKKYPSFEEALATFAREVKEQDGKKQQPQE